ncbi:MAG: YgiT-type zinc finger protein [Armatimonadetes bacterium]|nr:YgiT-type zinc finger protein [Armatimonadota bacterium]
MKSCYYCGSRVELRLIEYMRRRGGRKWIVRNVPTYVCTECGEGYYNAAVVGVLDQLLYDCRMRGSTSRITILDYDESLEKSESGQKDDKGQSP